MVRAEGAPQISHINGGSLEREKWKDVDSINHNFPEHFWKSMKVWFRYKKRILCVISGTIILWVGFSPIGWTGTATLAPAIMPLPASPDLGLSTKVVRQYALTSANDFPQRDPQNWRLLASNDGGRTWVTLDVRKGEFFAERHQRRVFA
ncbi:MAG TPA: hypothetical protein VNX46_04025, partial [Candidatus Acidoferrum sp.]|nr:hypothetical protein [Candidatus Acidoferrum sp.]